MWSTLPIAIDKNTTNRSSKFLIGGVFRTAIWVTCVVCENLASGQSPIAESERHPQTPIPATPSAAETATLLMHKALRQAVWGPAVACNIRQRTSLLEKQLVSVGKYAHAGQGSGQLKMHVRLVAGDQINTLIQVSDGRVMYSTKHIGDESTRIRVDLNRIREYLGAITTDSLEDPVIAMYLAVGGQAELLRKLVQQYKWTHVQAGRLGDVDVWWLNGELATTPPAVRALAEVDQLLFVPSNSGLLPTKVRIAIGKGDPLPFWLYQVEQAREESLVGIKSGTRLSMLLEFTEPTLVKEIPAELFRAQPPDEQTIVEETRRYLPPTPATAKAQSTGQLR